MSQLSSNLREAASRNHELLSALAKTDYAPTSLKQNTAYILDLQSQIKATDLELQKLHKTTEDERKDHLKYRDSTVKRFAHKLGGTKGKEKFTSRQEKEEREFLEAWQKEREATERREELQRALDNANNEKKTMEVDKANHDQAQKDLDEMYHYLFSGPTPEVPGKSRGCQVWRQRGIPFHLVDEVAIGKDWLGFDSTNTGLQAKINSKMQSSKQDCGSTNLSNSSDEKSTLWKPWMRSTSDYS